MFTGLVEEVGVVEALTFASGGARLTVACREVLTDSRPGSSIAVDGVCLTAIEVAADAVSFTTELSEETLERTAFRDYRTGRRVNLERPLRLDSRLGGHVVQGHVDAVGEVAEIQPGGGGYWLRLRIPASLWRYIAFKGSLAVSGISLTVAERGVAADGTAGIAGIAIIPHTYEHTTVCDWRPGTSVHLEADILAKYVETLLEPRHA